MWNGRAAGGMALLCVMFAAGCADRSSDVRRVSDAARASLPEQAGTLTVTSFRLTGWHDESFHYLPALSVTAPESSRPVFVQRVDFTADDAGTRRLLKGIRYPAAQRVRPGGTVDLVPNAGGADASEIASPLAIESISAIVFFTDDEGRTGIVSAAARVPAVPDRASRASLVIRHFTVACRPHEGRFLYRPELTLAETSGRSRASIKKIAFELLDVGSGRQPWRVWNAADVTAGNTIRLVTRDNGQSPWFEIETSDEASRMSVAISFVDDAGRGGLVSAIASVVPLTR